MWLTDLFLITVGLALPISYLLTNYFLSSSGPDTFTPQALKWMFFWKGFLVFYNRTNIIPLAALSPNSNQSQIISACVYVSINVNHKSQRNASQPPAVWLKPIDWTTQEGCKALLKREQAQGLLSRKSKGKWGQD